MTKMSKFVDKLTNVLVPVWSLLWITLLTALSVGGAIWAVKWVMKLLGVL